MLDKNNKLNHNILKINCSTFKIGVSMSLYFGGDENLPNKYGSIEKEHNNYRALTIRERLVLWIKLESIVGKIKNSD